MNMKKKRIAGAIACLMAFNLVFQSVSVSTAQDMPEAQTEADNFFKGGGGRV